MNESQINPYIDKIFGEWFKNIILIILLIPTIFIIVFGLKNKWIDQNFAVGLLFLLLGIYIGKWFENGKK